MGEIATVGAVIVAIVGLWHTIVIKPLIDEQKNTRADMSHQNDRVSTLQIDHAVLAATIGNLNKAIERLTEKLDRND